MLEDTLLGEGALSTAVDDELAGTGEEVAVYHRPGTASGVVASWKRCRVTALFEDADAWEAARPSAERALGGRRLQDTADAVVLEEALDDDWQEAMRRTYTPVQVTSTLRIVPHWPGEPEEPQASGVTNVRLVPGLAFGTGEHATTQLCLTWLQTTLRGGETVMDYGAGSAVLGLTALLCGAARCVCTDVDTVAVSSAAQNAELNGVSSRLEACVVLPGLNDGPAPKLQLLGGGDGVGAFDVVIANILLGPVLDLEPRLAAYAKPGGRLALSGVLETQAHQVVAAYSAHFGDLRVITSGEWALVTGIRLK